MPIFTPSLTEPTKPPDVAEVLAMIIEGLRRAAAAHASRWWFHAPLVWLLWPYLGRVAKRFEALAAQVRSGRLRPRRRPIAPAEPAETSRTPRPPKKRLPSMPGWLIVMLQHEAAGFASQLRHLLTGPEMAAVFEAAPDQAGRILRPLCRMLLVHPGPDLPPALFPPRAATPPEPSQRSSQVPSPSSEVLTLRSRTERCREAGAPHDDPALPPGFPATA